MTGTGPASRVERVSRGREESAKTQTLGPCSDCPAHPTSMHTVLPSQPLPATESGHVRVVIEGGELREALSRFHPPPTHRAPPDEGEGGQRREGDEGGGGACGAGVGRGWSREVRHSIGWEGAWPEKVSSQRGLSDRVVTLSSILPSARSFLSTAIPFHLHALLSSFPPHNKSPIQSLSSHVPAPCSLTCGLPRQQPHRSKRTQRPCPATDALQQPLPLGGRRL